MNLAPATLCQCGKPILASTKSGKCSECRQRTGGFKRPTSSTLRLVYVIGGASGPVKIGVSVNPNDRLAQLCNATETTKVPPGVERSTLRVLYATEGDKALEAHLHRRFQGSHVLGEWFDLGPPETAWRRVRDEVKSRPVVAELDLNMDVLNGSRHVAEIVHELYVAVLDPATRDALRGLFPEVLADSNDDGEVA